ncbi:MAG: replication-associated recombination protein A [Spirochaetes bacterium]|nr:replication-associated recombination protein A [Spirochaetota bacterium]
MAKPKMDEPTLFQKINRPPLAERMRPDTLSACLGQDEILAEGSPLREAIENDRLVSVIFWGPPGCGKTTLSRIIKEKTSADFIQLNAVTSGIADIKKAVAGASEKIRYEGKRTVLFIDEIHRFNKTQQDAMLPFVENGTIILIGATTENPSFEIIPPLLSRCKVYVFKPLQKEALMHILKNALTDNVKGLGAIDVRITDETLDLIINLSYNDARIALNTLEFAVLTKPVDGDGVKTIDNKWILDVVQKSSLRYDKSGDEHFNLISAVHKSMRDSDPDAAVYWTTRMLEGGEDPMYIARRIVRFASEDIGLADSNALVVAVAAKDACHFIGMPEAALALIQAASYMAMAPKSNAVYAAYKMAREDVRKLGHLPVPLVIRNAPTKLMKDLDYGKGYKYAHNYEGAKVVQQHMPDELKGRKYFF